MELKVIKGTSVNVSDAVFASEFNESVVHQVVTAHMAGARQGTKMQKTRSAVRGSTKKPWRQKGTGRARAGTRTGPIWRGGGVTFAAKPRDYTQKVNRKMYKNAMRSILSELVRQERLLVVKEIKLADHKTKTCKAWLADLGVDYAMIITHEVDKNLLLGAGNLPHVAVAETKHIDPVSLVHFDHVVITEDALKKIEESYA
jgi:large subunit ribosomal protein L4